MIGVRRLGREASQASRTALAAEMIAGRIDIPFAHVIPVTRLTGPPA